VGTPLVELRQVALCFGRQVLWENLNFRLEDPCWTALIGPSGSGKTSLMHLIAGLEKPSEGEVWVAGQRIDQLDDPALSRHRQSVVGTAFQHFHLRVDRSAVDNLLLPLYFSGANLEEGRSRAQEFMQALGLQDLLDSPVRQLSGGQRQRLALARALMNQPRLLLADEPIGNLDSESAQRVVELLARERARGMSLLVITHDDFLLQDIQDVYRLADGKLEKTP
jgi:putative ABC transport system ATP-binding protein